MTQVTCRLTAKNQDQLRYPMLGNQIWVTFTLFLSLTEQQDLSQNLAENQSDWVQVITIFLTVHHPLCEFYISPSKLLLTLQSTAMDGAVSFADKMAWNSITRVLTTAQMLCTAATVWQVLFCCFQLVRHFFILNPPLLSLAVILHISLLMSKLCYVERTA